MQHPLLLAPTLPPLAAAPSAADADFESNFLGPIAPFPAPPTAPAADVGAVVAAPRKPPVPLDLLVPPGARVIAVTGPNTGGKTVALKALGLAALMAKAGLYLPVATSIAESRGAESRGDEAGGDENRGEEGGVQPPAPALAWFDLVLADVGDGQSLQQNLSTFSGHVRRIQSILGAATENSLVLLDEV